jgi:hypothetical protein
VNLETYWLVVAPALLLGLSAVGWAGLWFTRKHETPEKPAGQDHPPAIRGQPFIGLIVASAMGYLIGFLRRLRD